MTSTVGGFPDHARVKLRYVSNFSSSPAGVTATDYVFRGNGCFDPDVTGTGFQPANWDDWSAQYTRYRCWGSSISWSIANSATGTVDVVYAVIGPRHLPSIITTQAAQANFQAQPYTVLQQTSLYRNGARSQSGFMKMSTEKFLGLTRTEFLGNDDLTALVSADPSHQWYWHFTLSVADQSSTVPHYFNVAVEYDVEFWDRVDTNLDLKYERLMSIRRIKQDHDAKLADEKKSLVPAAIVADSSATPVGVFSSMGLDIMDDQYVAVKKSHLRADYFEKKRG
jgi:hypothetical protein